MMPQQLSQEQRSKLIRVACVRGTDFIASECKVATEPVIDAINGEPIDDAVCAKINAWLKESVVTERLAPQTGKQ
jgi:hypothetical protein